jgi:uncharacterized damage-inducible protein DinB
MKELIIDLAKYHYWANKRLLELVQKLPDDLPDRKAESSFPSLSKTFHHLLWADSLWLQRMQMKEKPMEITEDFTANFTTLATRLLQQNELLIDWISKQKEIYLEHTVAYYNSQKKYYKTPVYQCLLQLFHHGTYHRGQIVTILRQLRVKKIPRTDYIVFKREKPPTSA